MIKYCLLFLLSPIFLKGQTQMAVSVDKLNVLYLGIKNPITVVASDIPPERLMVKAAHGSITREANHKFIYEHCEWVWGYETITVSDSLDPEIADTFDFHVRRFPQPEFEVIFPNTNFTGGLRCDIDYFGHDIGCDLKSFSVVYIPKNEDPIQKTNLGNRFTDEVVALFKRCTPGDRIAFSEISYTWFCQEKRISGETFFYQMQEDGTFKRIAFSYFTPPPEH